MSNLYIYINVCATEIFYGHMQKSEINSCLEKLITFIYFHFCILLTFSNMWYYSYRSNHRFSLLHV